MAISAFANYSTPDPKTRFSEAFFESLTFNEVQALVLPKILPRNSLHGWTWETAPPEGKFMSILEPTDYIPHIQDLQDILRNVEHLYGDEMCGVSLTLYTLLGVKTIHAHFSRIQLLWILPHQHSAIHLNQTLLQWRRRNRCGVCGEEGHDRCRCYNVHLERQEEQERKHREDQRAAREP
ncbi:hypothetical protein K439DRAFT_1622934 [Ramaria rubella]|nr:hypothetical protein K439DRAFT_1622934 [Ramaria rubella]